LGNGGEGRQLSYYEGVEGKMPAISLNKKPRGKEISSIDLEGLKCKLRTFFGITTTSRIPGLGFTDFLPTPARKNIDQAPRGL